MKHILHKMSYPGWIKVFDTLEEAKAELFSRLCSGCIDGSTDPDYPFEELNPESDIEEMLNSTCGAEYDYETAEGIVEQGELI